MAKGWFAGLLGVLVAVLIAGFWWGQTGGPHLPPALGRPGQQQPETPTPPQPTQDPAEVYAPIFTDQDALARTLAELPQGIVAHTTLTRLVTEDRFWEWNGGLPASSAGSLLSDPVWIVGVISDGLKVSDVMFVFNGPQASDPVEGAFYAWQANTGFLLAQGALAAQVPHSRAALAALPNQNLVIQLPAFVPTPEPTPTDLPLTYP